MCEASSEAEPLGHHPIEALGAGGSIDCGELCHSVGGGEIFGVSGGAHGLPPFDFLRADW
jgi:hypothetical protein